MPETNEEVAEREVAEAWTAMQRGVDGVPPHGSLPLGAWDGYRAEIEAAIEARLRARLLAKAEDDDPPWRMLMEYETHRRSGEDSETAAAHCGILEAFDATRGCHVVCAGYGSGAALLPPSPARASAGGGGGDVRSPDVRRRRLHQRGDADDQRRVRRPRRDRGRSGRWYSQAMNGPTPKPLRVRFDAAWEPEPNTGCWFWTLTLDHRRYGVINTGTFRVRHSSRAHRVAWALYCGPIPDGMSVLHRCDTPPCVNPDHLFLGTQRDNVLDMWAKGRARGAAVDHPLGSRVANAILTEDVVAAIKRSPERGRRLAERYGVHECTISDIRNGRTWRHVM